MTIKLNGESTPNIPPLPPKKIGEKTNKNAQITHPSVQITPKNAQFKPKNAPIKAYNMAIIDDDSAEINMYGDVVPKVPTDWRTGDRLGGYIGVDEFLEDLEEIKDKSNITVHINSGGGDLYAGLAIYNRLKALKGTVTTINDGMAASAASLIFQAGDIRQMNAGSTFMAHGVSGFLFGFYNVDDLKALVTEFKAHNKAVVNVYAEAMGVSYDEAKGFIDGETWLVGQEAVDKGLADEVIDLDSDGGEGLENNLFKRIMNRIQGAYPLAPIFVDGKRMANAAAVPPIADTNNKSTETGGNEDMDIKNAEELRNAYPDIVAQIENAAKDGVTNSITEEERARIKAIEEIEDSIADKDLVNEAKYGKNPMTAEQLALKAMQMQAAIGANMINSMKEDANNSGAAKVGANPVDGSGEKTEDEKAIEDAVALGNLYNEMKKGGTK